MVGIFGQRREQPIVVLFTADADSDVVVKSELAGVLHLNAPFAQEAQRALAGGVFDEHEIGLGRRDAVAEPAQRVGDAAALRERLRDVRLTCAIVVERGFERMQIERADVAEPLFALHRGNQLARPEQRAEPQAGEAVGFRERTKHQFVLAVSQAAGAKRRIIDVGFVDQQLARALPQLIELARAQRLAGRIRRIGEHDAIVTRDLGEIVRIEQQIVGQADFEVSQPADGDACAIAVEARPCGNEAHRRKFGADSIEAFVDAAHQHQVVLGTAEMLGELAHDARFGIKRVAIDPRGRGSNRGLHARLHRFRVFIERQADGLRRRPHFGIHCLANAHDFILADSDLSIPARCIVRTGFSAGADSGRPARFPCPSSASPRTPASRIG
ncbi:hypothetical protein Y046_3815 [Burkholderia pseudomallei MSHR2990]|nr:hypothetical protein Y046_3815 [Burkholderia pseudomallei MSHR2990]